MGTPAAGCLAAIEDLKTVLGPTLGGGAYQDDDLTRVIQAASAEFSNQTDRNLAKHDVVEVRLTGPCKTQTPFLVPEEYPVISVSDVQIDGTSITAAVLPDDTGWRLVNGVIYFTGVWWTPGTLYQLTYSAGYDTIPNDIQQAVLEMCCLKLTDRNHWGKQSVAMGGTSVSFLPSLLPQSVKGVINNYRAVRP
jgi:hypothetical protein